MEEIPLNKVNININIGKKRNLFGNDNMGKEGVVNEVGAMDMKFAPGNVSNRFRNFWFILSITIISKVFRTPTSVLII